MNTQEVNAPIEKIKDNPYQSKERDYSDIIEAFALSIAEFGLRQKPNARAVNGHFELEEGHRRLRAFQWLKANWKAKGLTNRYDGYKYMPLNVEELSDDAMFNHMVVENVHRKDLKPTEEATLLKQWFERHPNATSREAGVVFSKNDATIRGMVRLLDLPTEARKALDDGKISQNAARSLLSMQKVAPTAISQTLKEIEDEKESLDHSRWGGSRQPEEVVTDALEEQPEVMQLCWEGRGDGKPRAKGSDGWLLDAKNFPNQYLPALTPVDAAVALGIQDNKEALAILGTWINEEIEYKADKNYDALPYDKLIASGLDADLVEKIKHLINPPACSACPFYTTLRGTHYCGMKTCFTRKSQAWDREKLHKASKALGIDLYDPTDGAFKVLEESWQDGNKGVALFKKRGKDLRLALMVDIDRKKDQHGYEGVPKNSVVLVVGKAMQDMQVEKKVERVKKEEKFDIEGERTIRLQILNWEAAAYVQTLFDGLGDHAFKVLLQSAYEYNQFEDFLEEIEDRIEASEVNPRRLIAFDMLQHAVRWNSPTCVKHAHAVLATAKTWGVKIPARFMKLAEQDDAEIKELKKGVAVETKKK